MSTPISTDATHVAGNAERGGSRGRGGRGGKGRQPTRPNQAPSAGKGKVGPNRILDADWTKDSVMKDTAFVIWLGSGQTGDQQWTFHRPIGETPLDAKNQWVATPTRDIGFLLLRRDSEALASWKRQSELAIRQYTLHLKRGRKVSGSDQTEVWCFDGAPAIQPTIRTCMAAAKAAGANESAWLDYADRAVQVAERSFKEALRTQSIPRAWLRENPKPQHETRGGPLGDQSQVAIPFLNGLSMSAAKDKLLRVAIGAAPSEALLLPSDDQSDGEEDAEGVDLGASDGKSVTNATETENDPQAPGSWADDVPDVPKDNEKQKSPSPNGKGDSKASSSKKA